MSQCLRSFLPTLSNNMNLNLDSLVSETNLSFRLSDTGLTSRVDEVHTNNKQRTRVDKRVFWPQYFKKIEYVCLIGFRLT